AMLHEFAASAPFRVDLIDNPKGTAAAGFNQALGMAGGEVIVILGARAMPAPTFLSASVHALETSGADAVGGIVTAEAAGLQAEVVALALGSRFGVGDARYRYAS